MNSSTMLKKCQHMKIIQIMNILFEVTSFYSCSVRRIGLKKKLSEVGNLWAVRPHLVGYRSTDTISRLCKS